ncbi:MAG: carbohydrate kinase family protein, partial [Terriglobales bacterium]
MGDARGALVVGLGNACLDTFVRVATLPPPGGKTRMQPPQVRVGGQGAGTLAGCRRLGLRARLVATTGDDAAGRAVRRALRDEGIEVHQGRILAGVPTATAVILLDARGERTVLALTDPRLRVAPSQIRPALLDGAAALYVDGKDGAACVLAARWARARKLPVVADLDEWRPHTRALLPLVDHLIVPAGFAATLAHPPPNPVFVVTDGPRGAVGYAGGRRVAAPAFPVNAVDTTGAGDAFHAGYIYALLAGWNLAERLRFASATAALACTALGTL